jgi:hypothetical protein
MNTKPRNRLEHLRLRHALVAAMALLAGGGLGAQSSCCGEIVPPIGVTNLAVLQTGGLEALVGQSWTLDYDTALPEHWLRFTFGFATEEQPNEGVILDALSAMLEGPGGEPIAVLLTGDASGMAWTPPTLGAVDLGPGAVRYQTASFPDFRPRLPVRSAYEVEVWLPPAFASGSVRFDFQLFDAPNGQLSFAWCEPPTIVSVPEPSVLLLGLLGLLLLPLGRTLRL